MNKTFGGQHKWWLGVIGVMVLAGCNSGSPAKPQTGDQIKALVHGPVSSVYLEPLKSTISMTTYTGSQKPEDYQMLIFDGDAHAAADLKNDELVKKALRSGKLVLGVDLTAAHKKDGLGDIVHAYTCGNSLAYAVRVGLDANGRFRATVIEPSSTNAEPQITRSQKVSLPTPLAAQPCESSAALTAQSASPQATSAFAKNLLEEVSPSVRPAAQDGPPTIPPDLIYATYYFKEVFNGLVGNTLRHVGTQQPNYTVNRTFTVFLNNKNNPQGDFQYVLLEQDAAANPKTLGESFIAMGTRDGTDWDPGTYDDMGWFQSAMSLTLSANPTDWDLISTSPDTVNGTTSVTTSVSFGVGYKQSQGGFGSFSYSNTQNRDITSWQVDNRATNTQTQWYYRSQFPVSPDVDLNCYGLGGQLIWTQQCYVGRLPNDLSLYALKLYTQTVWQTPAVVDAPAGFSYRTGYQLLDMGCVRNGGPACYESGVQRALFQAKNMQGLSFDLGVVVPIPIASLTFSPNPVKAGTAVTGTLTLSKPAKMDTLINLASNSQNGTVLPSVTVKQGDTSATFQVLTNANGIAPGGSTVVTIDAFYAQNFQAQLTLTN